MIRKCSVVVNTKSVDHTHSVGSIQLIVFYLQRNITKECPKQFLYTDDYEVAPIGTRSPQLTMMYARSPGRDVTTCVLPRCKRDPDITIDDELISVHPRVKYNHYDKL